MKFRAAARYLATFMPLLLAACGGGGSSSSSSTPPTAANNPPVFANSSASVSVSENISGEVYTSVANDSDGDTLSYSLSGLDASLFTIDSSTGDISFNSSPDFENPVDDGNNNVYNLTVTVSDGTNSATQTVSISVTDLDDLAPVFTSSSDASVEENSTGIAYTATATDSDSLSSALTYSLSGSDASQFSLELNSGEVRFISPPDYETPQDNDGDNNYKLDITVSDGTNSTSQVVVINVKNLDEAPPTVKALRPQFANAGDRIEIVAEASDDVGIETYVWTQEDGASLSVNGQNTSTLEFTAPEVSEGFVATYKITVTDAESRSASEFVDITVNPTRMNEVPVGLAVSNVPGIDLTDEEQPFLIVVDGKVIPVDPLSPVTLPITAEAAEVAALTTENGDPVLMSFRGPEDGIITLSLESSADAFVMRSPRFFGSDVTDKGELSSRIRSHPKYDSLVSVIQERINTSPCPMSQACNARGVRIAEQIAQDITIDDLVVLGE